MTLISFWVTFTSTALNEPGSVNIKILCAVSELFNKQLDSLNLRELQHYNILMEYKGRTECFATVTYSFSLCSVVKLKVLLVTGNDLSLLKKLWSQLCIFKLLTDLLQ